jgi:hypothetical protein
MDPADRDPGLERAAQEQPDAPPRKQIVYPSGPAELAILEGAQAGVPAGVKMLAFRFNAPWEAVLIPLQAEEAEALGRKLVAASVMCPDAASSITGAQPRVPSGSRAQREG